MTLRPFIAGLILLAAQAAVAAPPRSHVLTIALDDSWQSKMLKSELTRDWTRPNAVVKTGPKFQLAAKSLNSLNRKIHELTVVFEEKVHEGVLNPAIRFGSGHWESIDRRAFRYSSLPLLSVAWYRDRFFCSDTEERQRESWNRAYAKRCDEERAAECRIQAALQRRYPTAKFICVNRVALETVGEDSQEFPFCYTIFGDCESVGAMLENHWIKLPLDGIDKRIPETLGPFKFEQAKPPWESIGSSPSGP